ncbi:MAG: hypothetical protein HQM00_13725 [Magnetococcales bacterium]|nr:hypothetical protein [Magnetococcales bacterium]
MIGQIGFSQRIQLSWLEYTAQLVLAGCNRQELTLSLQEYLRDKLSVGGQSERGNREKAISILINIWLVGRPEFPDLRTEGLMLLRDLPVTQHAPVHWGMTMAVYPFFGAVAEATGRLLRLQDRVSSTQVYRRLTERFGERETVLRAARRILRAFVDWGVLMDTGTPGVYRCMEENRIIPGCDWVPWLLLTRLVAHDTHAGALHALAQHPSLFPFSMETPSPRMFENRKWVTVTHHGFENEVFLTIMPS